MKEEVPLLPDGKRITGTLVWYYFICKREVWLMGHEITPDEEKNSLRVGRAIHDIYYENLRKEIQYEGIKIDRIRGKTVYEIKSSSKYLESAKFQLLYYVMRLKEEGLETEGELLIPRERKRIKLKMGSEDMEKLFSALKEISEIVKEEKPPEAVKIQFCHRCAYRDLCWA
ncbi:MAG: CRISPR-associated protein Cas4 [Candidatus Parvarchaeota archaeon]